MLRWGHGVYFGRVVPRIGALLSDRTAYAYLPKSLAYMPPWAEMKQRREKIQRLPPVASTRTTIALSTAKNEIPMIEAGSDDAGPDSVDDESTSGKNLRVS